MKYTAGKFLRLERDIFQTPTQPTVDPAKCYTLAELDLAEQHNPETELAWQNAKARDASLGNSTQRFVSHHRGDR